MHVSPAPDGKLLVDHPEPDLRFDIGNPRLYAAVHGNGHISDFLLPEGIPVLRTWAVHARLDGVPVTWAEAEAIGRSWTLRGTALDGAVRCRTVCDSERPALFQVWRIENPGTSERVFTLDLDVTFDLRYPAIRVGAASTTARLFHLVRDHPIARRTLGRRRWAILDTIGNAQKRLKPGASRQPVTVDVHRQGLRVRGDIGGGLWAGDTPAAVTPHPNGATLQFRAVLPPGARHTLPLVVGAGELPEASAYRQALTDADAYAAWLSETFEHDDPLLRSMFVACLNNTIANYKELPSGFAGLWAGPAYAFPPRLYFRDSYWAALPLLPYRPEWVRKQLFNLATGVHADGTCPSGVIDPAALPLEDQGEPSATDWMSDHQDSPAFFVLLLHDYVAWTGDNAVFHERLDDGRTLWECAQACLNRLTANPAKPRAPNDWTNNVLRSDWVTYDLALSVGALKAGAALAQHLSEANTAASYTQDAQQIAELLQIHNWDDERGYYVDYRRTGENGTPAFVEDHLALDTVLALRFDAAPPERAERVLEAMKQALQTRNNPSQPFEDWGVMVCWPPYGLRADLFGKSAKAYNCHNGAEWPYLSAIYAQALLERHDPDWRYTLTRWWEIQLANAWLTPIEYHTPAHAPGALLQGWSAMPVSAMIAGGLNLTPTLQGDIAPRAPAWGTSVFRHVQIHGRPTTITVDDDTVTIS